jgi:hypothetical protein
MVRILLFPVMVLIIYIVLAFGFDIYTIFPWFDIPFHAAGGLSIGWAGVLLINELEKRKLVGHINKWVIVLFSLSLVALIAILWELHEFIFQLYFPPEIPMTLDDTMLDFVMGLLGGLFGSVFVSGRNSK